MEQAGDAVMTSTDSDGNGTIRLGTDQSHYSVHPTTTNANGIVVRETSTYACSATGSASSNLISVTRSSVDGVRS